MLAPVLLKLVELDPANSGIFVTRDGKHSDMDFSSMLHTRGAETFRAQYKELNSGWKYAMVFSNACVRFPIPMLRNDHWVFQAYLMSLDPRRFYQRDIATAYHIANPPAGMEHMRSVVQSLIMTFTDGMSVDHHLRRVAAKLRIPPAAMFAYESLFFNVFDRRSDGVTIAMNIYPNGGRLEELSESYFRDSPMGKMLERAGYNYRDMDLSSYLAGIGDRSYLSKLAATENGEAELTKQIMGNGLLLTKTNLLNHRSPGWSRATGLITAARQGGATVEEPPLADIGAGFLQELAEATSQSRETTIDRVRSDAGAT